MPRSGSRRWFSLPLVVAVLTRLTSWSPAWAEEGIVVVGRPDGLASSDRLDVHRSGRTTTRLPRSPVERWRIGLQSTIELPPVMDRDGAATVVFANGEVARLAPSGTVEWRRRIPGMLATVPPVLLADGSVLLVTADATVHRVEPTGRMRPSIALHGTALQTPCAPFARDDGSLVLALDGELVVLEATGEVTARAALDATERLAGGLLPFDGGVMAVGTQGRIWFWRAPAAPVEWGRFGGETPDGATLLGRRALAAVVGRERLVVFDPLARSARTLLQGTALARLEGPATLGPTGEVLLVNGAGELIAVGPTGAVVRRVELAPSRRIPSAPSRLARPGHDILRNPPPIVDPSGAVAYFRRDGRLGVVDASGEVRLASSALCAQPLAVLPAGEGAMLAVCAGGQVTRWVDR